MKNYKRPANTFEIVVPAKIIDTVGVPKSKWVSDVCENLLLFTSKVEAIATSTFLQ